MLRVNAFGFTNLRLLAGGGELDVEYVPPEPEPEEPRQLDEQPDPEVEAVEGQEEESEEGGSG